MDRLRENGLRQLVAHRFAAVLRRKLSAKSTPTPDVITYCRAAGIRLIETDALDTQRAIDAVRVLQPDLLIHAGASILRRPIIELPRLGILNAHMGLLPEYRGVNVVEWAWLNGDPVGCSVHLIDAGIDTGPLLARREARVTDCRDFAMLRATVDAAQIDLLGDVVARVRATGKLPPPLGLRAPVERQYFVMHSDLRAILATALSRAP